MQPNSPQRPLLLLLMLAAAGFGAIHLAQNYGGDTITTSPSPYKSSSAFADFAAAKSVALPETATPVMPPEISLQSQEQIATLLQDKTYNPSLPQLDLDKINPAAGSEIAPPQKNLSSPSKKEAEQEVEQEPETLWQAPEVESLSLETVLVPKKTTVISSSQDGQIEKIPFENGDHFKKGDVLIKYDCKDLEAEAQIANLQKQLLDKKKKGAKELYNLDVISDIDRIGAETEDKQAEAKVALYKAKLNACEIKAAYDGRVTKRLANEGEYTRTDRVLLETVSNEALQARFMLPSKWLRWVNIGAPVTIAINETERTYKAKITRIYGEIDPASQSIQIVTTLDDYFDPLLPGMSGKAKLDFKAIRQAGVTGYLQSVNAN